MMENNYYPHFTNKKTGAQKVKKFDQINTAIKQWS